MLLYVIRYWPDLIFIMLWPFSTKCAQDGMNHLHVYLNLETPDMKFSNTKAVNVQLKHYHTFGFRVYKRMTYKRDAYKRVMYKRHW